MAFIDVNGARLYYEVFGAERPGRAPIVLIHGSTITGRTDWSAVAPCLAQSYRVIVPDCRGHGQSSNPNLTYSFAEMAADTAALIRALGYERAHVIGHSNGGNVALVTLVEHPEVVQACVAQAANAYVSQDLIDREPRLFDPDRVARESPDWMNEMIALHGPAHGPDYWRDLLRLTVQAIVSEPNYTPEDLARVARPTLVIQGANDGVNAPSRHAQYIARYIPFAEAWLPEGVGHSVHFERLPAWLRRVLGFLERRGDDANEALYRLRCAHYGDWRETIFAVRAEPVEGGLRLAGSVLTPDQREAARAALPAVPVEDRVQVLLDEATPWALVSRSVVPVRRRPNYLAEQTTQVCAGEVVRILGTRDDYALVRIQRDGYLGWMHTAALWRCDGAEAARFRADCDALVVAELAQAYDDPTAACVGKLPFGVALPCVERRRGYGALRLPDGRVWWVDADDLLPVAERPAPDAVGIAFTLNLIRRSVGVPYDWGGCTPFGYDCSGLTQAFMAFMGVAIPRDASQQYLAGRAVDGAPQPGDLLYFGEPDSDDPAERVRITHTAISLGGDDVIHANGSAGGISINSLHPDSPLYRPWLRERLAGVRRFA